MGSKSRSLIKKIEKKVIKKLGQDLTFRRNQSSGDTDGLDAYGEPLVPSGYSDYDERTIRVVVESVGYEENLTTIGGLSNERKEKLKGYISQSEAVALDDIIYYPKDSTVAYFISKLEPNVFQDDIVVYYFEAERDPTT